MSETTGSVRNSDEEDFANAAPSGDPMSMGAPGGKATNFGPSLNRLVKRLFVFWPALIAVVFMATTAVALNVIAPKLLGDATNIVFEGFISQQLPSGFTQEQVIDQLRAAGQHQQADFLSGMQLVPGSGIDFVALTNVIVLVLCIYIASSVLMWLQGLVLNDVTQRASYRMRSDVEQKVHRLPLAYFDGVKRGEILSRVTNDIDNVQQTLQQVTGQILTSLLTLIGVLVMMFVVSPILALIALITIPLSGVITVVIAKRSQKLFAAQWAQTGRLSGQVEEAFTGHELVKVFGHRREVEQEFTETNERLYKASFGAQFVSGIIMPAMMFVGNLVYVLIAIVGGLRVASGQMTLGAVQAFIQYSRQFTQPLTELGSMANMLQSGVASAERIFELLDAEDERPDDDATERLPSTTHGELVFDNVSFSYLPDEPLIEHLSFTARPGQTVAIVGPTGAGKTTLVNLIMRFYEVNDGRILLDGVDISRVRRQDLRRRIGMVLQDTWLFGGTIRDNIVYGRPDATEEEMVAAARQSFVDRFVRQLPDGYDTVLEDDGSNVSQGEKQLLTIARALLIKPSLLILDEATSSVDTRTELLIQQAMAELRKDRTSFVIAHRLSTIRDADLIIVMEHGRIVEQGRHDDLVAADGAFARLYRAQFEVPEEGDGATPALAR